MTGAIQLPRRLDGHTGYGVPRGPYRICVRVVQIEFSLPSMTMGDMISEELEDLMHFSVHDLPTRGYSVMEEIRRQGKLCDVTLKV